MQLSWDSIQKNRDILSARGYRLPNFNYEKVRENTLKAPRLIHFGAGNLFKAFPAFAVQKLLDSGVLDSGFITAEGYDYELVEKTALPYDNLTILTIFPNADCPDAQPTKTIVASVMESLILDPGHETDFNRLLQIFAAPSLQMASFTITEKGYVLPSEYLQKVTSLLYHRFLAGAFPIALVSMDNCSHNGELLKNAILKIAKDWKVKEFVPESFVEYLSDSSRVSFPWTMIDKITPRPAKETENLLKADGFKNISPIFTAKKSYTAPFVNAEATEYLVIEDNFPNGRPPLEHAGIYFTSRDIVDCAEKMKVGTCLNPLHTALAIFSCLLGYKTIDQGIKDKNLLALVKKLGYDEGLPVVSDPGIIHPKDFLDDVINNRLPNSYLADDPYRIATDTSLKLPVRFGETLKAYRNNTSLSVRNLEAIPLIFAGWLRYLCGTDDKGKPLTPSPDPNSASVTTLLKSDNPADLQALLADAKIWGVNLVEIGLADKVEFYFRELSAGPGAVGKMLGAMSQ